MRCKICGKYVKHSLRKHHWNYSHCAKCHYIGKRRPYDVFKL